MPQLYVACCSERCLFQIGAILGTVIYLHIEYALYAQKSVSSWFLAVFDSKIDVC